MPNHWGHCNFSTLKVRPWTAPFGRRWISWVDNLRELRIQQSKMATGWWFQPTPLKNMSLSVGIIIPNTWKVIKAMFQTTNKWLVWPLTNSLHTQVTIVTIRRSWSWSVFEKTDGWFGVLLPMTGQSRCHPFQPSRSDRTPTCLPLQKKGFGFAKKKKKQRVFPHLTTEFLLFSVVTQVLLQWSLELVYKAPMMAGKRTSLKQAGQLGELRGFFVSLVIEPPIWETDTKALGLGWKCLIPWSKASDSEQAQWALVASFIYHPQWLKPDMDKVKPIGCQNWQA